MNRHRKSASAALVIAACCLSACSAPKAPPELHVTSVSPAEGRTVAKQLCSDLASMTDEKAIGRMAVRASEMQLSSDDQDAILDYAAAAACPDEF